MSEPLFLPVQNVLTTGGSVLHKFSLITYNVLAQCLVRRELYPWCTGSILKWATRKKILLNELKTLNSDIFCIQECDNFVEFWEPSMLALGYTGVFTKKPKQFSQCDGCATFFKNSKFKLIGSKSIDFNTLAELHEEELCKEMLVKNNIAQVVALEFLEEEPAHPTRQRLVVFNTHLYWNWKYRFTRLRQMSYSMQETFSFVRELQEQEREHNSSNNSPPSSSSSPSTLSSSSSVDFGSVEKTTSDYHFIFAGDFNMNPSTPVYAAVTCPRDQLDEAIQADFFLPPADHYDPLITWMHPPTDEQRRAALQKMGLDPDTPARPVSEEQNRYCLDHVRELLRQLKGMPRLLSIYSHHQYRLLSPPPAACEKLAEFENWNHEPVYTVFTDNWQGTLDYIFLLDLSTKQSLSDSEPSSSSSSLGHPVQMSAGTLLQTSSLLYLPQDLPKSIPNDNRGSDHLPLGATFEIVQMS